MTATPGRRRDATGTAAATIVAKPYLSHARVLARSFREHHPEIPFFTLLADEVEGRFDPVGLRFRYGQQQLSTR